MPGHIEGLAGDVAKIPVTWKGHPDFPLSVRTERVLVVVPEATSEERAERGYLCTERDAERSPFMLEVLANDVAGIETPPSKITVTCFKRPESEENGNLALVRGQSVGSG